VLAAGLSGVRPGVALVDGRRIHLRIDPLVLATVAGALPGIFKSGSGTLDPNGEATGELDLAPLNPPPGGIGTPLWMALVVLDPQAPAGVRYLPDTYVMRI
jgi:hypothetical protein